MLLSPDLQNRLRNAAYWLRGHPANLTLASMARIAFEDLLCKLSKQYNKGKPFPPPPVSTQPDRPE